jgi:hypothetical protein
MFGGGGPDPDDGRIAQWPPVVGEIYPDWELLSISGEFVSLSSFRGKVVVIELVGMPCKACQAFSGAHWRGGFAGIEPQKNLQSIDELVPKHADGMRLSDPRIEYIQLLLYDMNSSNVPSLDEARAWATHFGAAARPNAHVLIGNSKMLSPATRKMIPGFHLLDHTLKLRAVSGNPPRDNLYTEVIPMIPRLVSHVE